MAWQQHIAARTGDRRPESKYTPHRRRRHASGGSHGTNTLYLDCQHDPVRLTEHLRGTRESEHKEKGINDGDVWWSNLHMHQNGGYTKHRCSR